jgi:hypothetical protein
MRKSMIKSLRNLLILAVVIQLIIPLPVLAAAVGEFTVVMGDVTLMRKGRTIKPTVKTAIETKDVIVTGKSAMAKIALTDGSELTIAQRSKLEIKDYLFQKQKRSASFSLSFGKLRSQVKKHFGRDSSYQVYTPTAVAGVRGSEFVSLVELAGTQGTSQSTFYAVEETLTVYNPELAAQVVTVDAGNFTVVAAGSAPSAPAAFSPAVLEGVMGDLVSQVPTVTGAAATAAGETAAAATVAGIAAGTVAAVAAGAAVITAVIVTSTTSSTTTTHHATTAHH